VIEDPRQARTRAALSDALMRLLASSPLDSISVAALCREAGVHRTTFYGHAAGVEEFAVDFLTRDLDLVTAVESPSGPGIDLSRYRTALITLLAHVADERALYRPLLQSRWGGSLRAAIDGRLRERFLIALDVFRASNVVGVPDQRTEAVAFLTGALVGMIASWAASDDVDAVAAADRVLALMPAWWPIEPKS